MVDNGNLREVAMEIKMAATVRLIEALRVSNEGASEFFKVDLSTVISNEPLILLETLTGNKLEKYWFKPTKKRTNSRDKKLGRKRSLISF